MSINSYNHRLKRLSSRINRFLGLTLNFLRLNKRKNGIVSGLDERLVYSLSASRIPSIGQLGYLHKYLTPRERLVFKMSSVVLILAAVLLVGRFYYTHLDVVPVRGGKLTEGVVGIPKYVNPLYSSINDVDMDLVSLVYSGLYKRDGKAGLINDLAESKTVSADGKLYTIKIRAGVKFHNKTALTANDVLFTFNAIKDFQYKSPLRISFSGVEAEVIDDQTINFKLKESFAGFTELLTFGILPQELWGQLAPNAVSLAELNLKPIGSGPYKFKSLVKDKSGNLKEYGLEVNNDYFGTVPYIENVSLKFYPSYEEATPDLNNNAIDGLAFYPSQVSSELDKSYISYLRLNVPQEKGIFFNLKSDILSEKKIRQALALAIDKPLLVNKLLGVNAEIVDSPILQNSPMYSGDYKKYNLNREEARRLIEAAGWKLVDVTAEDLAKAEQGKNSTDAKLKKEADDYLTLGAGKWYYKNGDYLIIRLSAVDAAENSNVLSEVKNMWEGVRVKTIAELVPVSQIQNDIIKTRDYDALFSGEVLSADADPFPFWHSSQIGSEGLNLSNYSSKEADKALEAGRQQVDAVKRKELYKKFLAVFSEDMPAVFLYSPKYIYAVNNRIKDVSISAVVNSSDRLSDINNWHIETGKRFKK